ncbi:unnamed protein product [Camellia sinensis]
MHAFDRLAEERVLLQSEMDRRRAVRCEVWKLYRKVEWLWHQQSRMKWSLQGDKNTRFFHAVASTRHNRNMINSISINGVSLEEPSRVKHEVFLHFKKHFKEGWAKRPVLGGDFSLIEDTISNHLVSAFTEAEVWAAIKESDSNKAPGPDGFNLLGYQKFWGIMKKVIMQFFQDFHNHSRLTYGINSSFITLIPKTPNPTNLSDYRPISLVGSLYKILAKVLSHRLKSVMPSIIGDSQTAFIGGRNILDGVLIANEVVDGWKKAKQQGLIIKLDFEKAFDSVNWEFLFSLMSSFGFGPKWISWIKTCVSTPRVSILVNGSPTHEFSPQRGLRQGDPLSPFLFNLVAEGLNILLNRALNLGILHGVSVGVNGVLLSHLQFADDSIFFCKADLDQVVIVKRLLRCFEVLSGLRINYHKSVVCGVGLHDECLNEIASLLNCQVQRLPLKFLGLPLGANPGRKSTWKPVLDNIRSRLSGWKRKMLSFAGRLTLIKSVLSSLPVYYLSLFKMPEGVAREIEKIEANFLWGGDGLKRKVHLVKWMEVTKSVAQGGLGIRRIRDVNACLLLKWWWKFGNQISALWRQVVCSKYKIEVQCWHPPVQSSYKLSRVWKDIICIGLHSSHTFQSFLDNCQIKVGNGSRIRFWHDKWCGSTYLKDEFPSLFNLSADKNGSLQQYYARKTSTSVWNFPYRRILYSWEETSEARLNTMLSSAPSLCLNSTDSLVWSALGSCAFSVSSLYSLCTSLLGPPLVISKFIWSNTLPPKVSFFGWLAWKNRVKTAVFLLDIGILSTNVSPLCPLCKVAPESISHVLLHCHFSWVIWSSVLFEWGLCWCIPQSVDALFNWWMGTKLKHPLRKFWEAIPLVVLWSLWKLRNECVFRDAHPNSAELWELIKIRLALWLKASVKNFPFSVEDVALNWRLTRLCYS